VASIAPRATLPLDALAYRLALLDNGSLLDIGSREAVAGASSGGAAVRKMDATTKSLLLFFGPSCESICEF
jgi:hypothetical protein